MVNLKKNGPIRLCYSASEVPLFWSLRFVLTLFFSAVPFSESVLSSIADFTSLRIQCLSSKFYTQTEIKHSGKLVLNGCKCFCGEEENILDKRVLVLCDLNQLFCNKPDSELSLEYC